MNESTNFSKDIANPFDMSRLRKNSGCYSSSFSDGYKLSYCLVNCYGNINSRNARNNKSMRSVKVSIYCRTIFSFKRN